MFGQPSTPPMRQMPPQMPAQTPYRPSFRNMQPTPQQMQMPRPHMMPGYGVQGGQGPWYRRDESMMPAPPPDAGYNRRW